MEQVCHGIDAYIFCKMSAHVADAVGDAHVFTADPVFVEKEIQYMVEDQAHAGQHL